MATVKHIELSSWISLITDPEHDIVKKISHEPDAYRKLFVLDFAQSLYNDMRRSGMPSTKDFSELDDSEKEFWHDYVSRTPEKFISIGIKIKPSSGFYRTCIISDEEIHKLSDLDLERYPTGPGKWYYTELNYLIPVQMKKLGFEIVRPGVDNLIAEAVLKKLAKAIHSRYLKQMSDLEHEPANRSYPGLSEAYLMEFDDLPEEIQYSNIDNAHHIATKLLAIGYRVKPVKPGFEPVTLRLDEYEIETMAKIEHSRWSWDKRLNGWIYGITKDSLRKTHPGLIPYEDLAESEKEKDRELVKMIPSLLRDIEYVAYPVSPGTIKELSFPVRPKSSIHNLLSETRKLNEEVNESLSYNPEISRKIAVISRKIEDTIAEVEGNYNYARHIQKTYLPEDLFIRECCPDSFVLFRPKDIVSGDFYFFSKQGSIRIFAAADCTGHGIPGALLSTLGYGITDQAVNELRLTDPAKILCHIYSKVHKFLRHEEQSSVRDDMDMAVCCLDLKSRILQFAGITIPVLRFSHGEMLEYKAANFSDVCNEGGSIINETIQAEKGDVIYLCTDGFADQFGGNFHKKYQRPRLKSFLHSVHHLPMPEQKDLLYDEFEKWRSGNDEDQTDDILIIGIKI